MREQGSLPDVSMSDAALGLDFDAFGSVDWAFPRSIYLAGSHSILIPISFITQHSLISTDPPAGKRFDIPPAPYDPFPSSHGLDQNLFHGCPTVPSAEALVLNCHPDLPFDLHKPVFDPALLTAQSPARLSSQDTENVDSDSDSSASIFDPIIFSDQPVVPQDVRKEWRRAVGKRERRWASVSLGDHQIVGHGMGSTQGRRASE